MKTAEIKNQNDLNQLFESVVEQFRRLRWQPFLDRSLRVLEDEHRAYFVSQQSPAGEAWAPLSPATIRAKGHDRILFHTGRLMESLAAPKSGDGVRSTWDEWPQAGLIFGTDVPYSIYHEQGRANMPARPHIGLRDAPFTRMAEMAVDHAFAELKK